MFVPRPVQAVLETYKFVKEFWGTLSESSKRTAVAVIAFGLGLVAPHLVNWLS